VVAAIEVVVEGVSETMKHWAWHTGNIRTHLFAYDSCTSDATFQKLIASNEDITQPFKQLLVHPVLHARCMKSKREGWTQKIC